MAVGGCSWGQQPWWPVCRLLGRARRTQQKSETRSRAGTSVPLQPCRHPMTDGARSAYSQGIPRAAAGESGPRFDGGGREAQLRADSSSLFFFRVAFWRLFGSGSWKLPRFGPLPSQTARDERVLSTSVSFPDPPLPLSHLPRLFIASTTAGSVRSSPGPPSPSPLFRNTRLHIDGVNAPHPRLWEAVLKKRGSPWVAMDGIFRR